MYTHKDLPIRNAMKSTVHTFVSNTKTSTSLVDDKPEGRVQKIWSMDETMNKPKSYTGASWCYIKTYIVHYRTCSVERCFHRARFYLYGRWTLISLHNTLKNGCALAQALACDERDMRFVHPSVRA